MITTASTTRQWITHTDEELLDPKRKGVYAIFRHTDDALTGQLCVGCATGNPYSSVPTSLWFNAMSRKDLKLLRDFINEVLEDWQ